jgi:glycosyltransferase involved in cell wall biosynthesis
MTPSPIVTVVIPTYQRCESLKRTLVALAEQTLAAEEYEVIVSIDGSEDGTCEMVNQFSSAYALQAIWHANRGRAAACNSGVQVGRGRIIVLLDDDMEPVPEFLARHVAVHSTEILWGVVGAVPIEVDSSSPPILRYVAEKFNRHLEELAQLNRRFRLRDFYSGNFSTLRDTFLQVGGFDEAFKVYGNEDLELSIRLTSAGVQLVFDPLALAYQRYRKDFRALASDHVGKGWTSVMLATKHPHVLPDLKLSTYYQGSFKWRAARTVLLMATRVCHGMPDLAIRAVQGLERSRLPRLDLYYRFVLDYFYWLGVIRALHENRHTYSGLSSLAHTRTPV